ncbi:hypothetical protein P9112_002851 [Eukaryota sp. TZLM1-RC]
MSRRNPARSARPKFQYEEVEEETLATEEQPKQQPKSTKAAQKPLQMKQPGHSYKRYGPGQLMPGGKRAGKGGCDKDLETGEEIHYEEPQKSGVEHLGKGQILPKNAGRCEKSEGCDVDLETGERLD